MSANLNANQTKSLQQIMVLAEQKKGQKRSKEIEKSGGEFSSNSFP